MTTFKVYTRSTIEGAYSVEAPNADEAREKLSAYLDDDNGVELPYEITDQGTEELTGEVT
jgi:hypothetical protein